MERKVFILEDQMDVKLPIITQLLSISKDEINITKAHNYAEAMIIFSIYKKFDLAFFDFNLRDVKSGLDVAKLSKAMEVQFDKVIVHSSDSEGGGQIADELEGEQLQLDEMIFFAVKVKNGTVIPPDNFPFKNN
jgi:hypothetical protein